MGSRSTNVLILASEALLPSNMYRYLGDDVATVYRHIDGPILIVMETNIAPLSRRDDLGLTCALDLEAEFRLQQFLGTLNRNQFYFMRNGEDAGTRGAFTKHPFVDHEDVLSVASELAGDIANNNSIKIVGITLLIEVKGVIDQQLIDHLGMSAEGSFNEMQSSGRDKPSDAESGDCYADTALTLVSVDARLV
jgi:hypothetical protein